MRSTEWRGFIANDPRFTATAVRPTDPLLLPGNHMVSATVLVKD